MSTTPKLDKKKPANRDAKTRGANGTTPRVIPEELLNRSFPDPLGRTPEQILIDRERIMAKSQPQRLPPDGMTVMEHIMGQWPGDETDAEIEEALRRIS
ncbi:MAG: hypothetical protein ABJA67_10565 [Chthonomonadales bacterium]